MSAAQRTVLTVQPLLDEIAPQTLTAPAGSDRERSWRRLRGARESPSIFPRKLTRELFPRFTEKSTTGTVLCTGSGCAVQTSVANTGWEPAIIKYP